MRIAQACLFRPVCTTDSMDPSFLSRAARYAINTICRLLGLTALFLIAYSGAVLGTGADFRNLSDS